MKSELIEQSMSIILYAGDARTYCEKALNEIADFEFDKAREQLEICETYIIQAHTLQTKIVQREAAGEMFDYLMLFAHAQDTLMTIASEIRMTKKLLKMYERLDKRLQRIEP